MSAIDNQPISVNLQSPTQFKFELKRAPSLSYYFQKLSIPSLTLPPASVPTPTVSVPLWGDHIRYEPLTVTFKVDDDLQNWLEIYNWMTALANPAKLGGKYIGLETNPDYSSYGLRSEIQVYTLDSQNNPSSIFTFHRAWPTSLSGPQFESTADMINYVNSTVSFMYIYYSVSDP